MTKAGPEGNTAPPNGVKEGMERDTIRRGDQLDRRHDLYLRRGVLASIVVHLILFLVFGGRGRPPSPFSAAGPRAGDDRAAAAGGGVQVVQLRPPTPFEILRPPEPILLPEPTVETVDFEPEVEQVSLDELSDRIGLGEAEGPETGQGIEGGEGEGDGGTAAEGRFRLFPPKPRGLIIPPSDRPKRVRGREVEVRVFVTSTGAVVADSTRLFPPTGDRGFDDRLLQDAADWVFEPAQRGGRTVAGWFVYELSL
ncbi:MAG: hypothetical protein ABFS34_13620 [Gemmatimonadota bacterium]